MKRYWVLLLLVMACLCASCQTPEQRALRMIGAHGGTVMTDDTLPGDPVVAVIFEFGRDTHFPNVGFNVPLAILVRIGWECEFSDIRGLKALRRLDTGGLPISDANLNAIGDLEHLQRLNLYNSEQFTDAGLKHMGRLKNLVSLDLGATGITDAGLKHLKGLKKLEDLNLVMTHITDSGLLDLLKELKVLRQLDLTQTGVTGAGMGEGGNLERLVGLRLDYTKITDYDMKGFKGMTALVTLSLAHTDITDVGVKELAGLTNLVTLSLAHTDITDAGMKELAGMKRLADLDLSEDRITDAGLKELEKVECLARLHLGGTFVSKQGLAAFEKAMPHTVVYYDRNPDFRRYLPPLDWVPPRLRIPVN